MLYKALVLSSESVDENGELVYNRRSSVDAVQKFLRPTDTNNAETNDKTDAMSLAKAWLEMFGNDNG